MDPPTLPPTSTTCTAPRMLVDTRDCSPGSQDATSQVASETPASLGGTAGRLRLPTPTHKHTQAWDRHRRRDILSLASFPSAAGRHASLARAQGLI